ncbi:MAG: GNAT family N-acetyltransferase [Thermoanaerobaculia bacterium]
MTLAINNNTKLKRFENHFGGAQSTIKYEIDGDTITFTHTHVPKEVAGSGIAGAMAEAALRFAESSGLKVVAKCEYVAAYIKKHPEFEKLLK